MEKDPKIKQLDKEILDTQQLEYFNRKMIEILEYQVKNKNSNKELNNHIDQIKIENSNEDYLKKNKEKIDKLDNQNTQVVKKYVEVVKEDVPKETIEEQIQFNREKEKVSNLMVESFKINYMAEKGLKEITNHNDFLNFMEDKFITKISNLDDEDLKYKVYNDFESLRDKYIKDNNVNRQHNQSSTSKEFLDEKKKYLLAQSSQEISFNELFF